jgi:hypothetical protein
VVQTVGKQALLSLGSNALSIKHDLINGKVDYSSLIVGVLFLSACGWE